MDSVFKMIALPPKGFIMKNIQIAVIVGSLRKDSFNKRLAHVIAQLAPEEFNFSYVDIGGLGLYNQDHDGQESDAVKCFKNEIASSDGLLFATPEYNRSIPGVLKNALDHGSRPYGHNVWAKKPAGIIGASPGSIGTAVAQQHLRTILAYLDVHTLGQPEAFMHITDDFFQENQLNSRSQKFIKNWVDIYVAWIKKHV